MTARTSDPATSHLAATYIAGKRPGLKDAFLQALKVLGPSTANEIAQWCVQSGVSANAESVRKRAKELIDDGLAKYGPQKECSVTKQQAGTLELTNANPSNSTDEPKCANADRREGTSDSGRDRIAEGHRQTVPSQRNVGQPNQTRQETVQPPKANVSDTEARIQAAAEFVKSEREWVAIFKVAVELAGLSKVGTWPKGDSNEYIVAIESAALMGLIERAGSNVRRKREVVEAKAVQGSLFE